MRKIRNFLCFFICSFHLNCPTTEEQMLYFTIFCLFRHSFIIKNLVIRKKKRIFATHILIDMEKKQIIEAMHNRLHEIDPHAKAILFGSRARGTEHEGSDWDVLILLDKPKVTLQDYDKYSYPLRELGWDIDEIINPILFSQKEWEENHYTLFNHNITREGITI